MYDLSNTPTGTFFVFFPTGERYQTTAQDVYNALQEDGQNPADGYHSVVDFGMSNMGRYGTRGKRLFLFVPDGANLAKVRGLNG